MLLDVDGVLADFVSPALAILEVLGAGKFTHADVKTWEICEAIGRPDLVGKFYKMTDRAGFCYDIPVIAGAKAGVKQCRTVADVMFVTSPMDNQYWVWERNRWLQKHFKAGKKSTIQTDAKHAVSGHVFVDDKPSNVREWLAHNKSSIGILWDAPYNRDVNDLPRLSSWEDLVTLLRER